MSEKQNIGFALRAIKTIEFATVTDSFKEDGVINIESNFDFSLHGELPIVFVRFNCYYKCDNNLFIVLKCECAFEIEPESFQKFKINENIFKLSKGLLTHLGVLTVGTTRGILHSKVENSKFSFLILPTINVTEMIKEDMEFHKIENQSI